MNSSSTQSDTIRFLLWGGRQLGVFLTTLATALLLGLIRSLRHREFSWRGFFYTCLLQVAGISCALWFSLPALGIANDTERLLFWGVAFITLLMSGVVGALTSRSLAYWECYLASWCSAFICAIYLSGHMPELAQFGAESNALGMLFHPPPGARLFGAMWERVWGLAACAGFLCALFASSTTYMVKGSSRNGERSTLLGGVEWILAKRYLSGGSGIASLTAVVAILGIALGVGALISVTAVMSGYQKDVQDKIMSTNAHLVLRKYGVDFTEYDNIVNKVLKVDGILAGTPFVFGEAMVSDGIHAEGILVKGISPDSAGSVTHLENNLCQSVVLSSHTSPCIRYTDGAQHGALSSLLTPHDNIPSLLVGLELFKTLGQPVGSVLRVVTPVGIAGVRGHTPKQIYFRLAGVFSSGMHEFDARLTYLRLDAAQQLLGLGDAVSGLEFRVENADNVEYYSRATLSAVGHYPYTTLDWRELNAGIFTALSLQKIVMFLVLCFIIIVASFNIASTLFMTVVEKSAEVGVLKAMGARDISVMKIFVLQGWVVGGIGTVLGVAMGTLLCVLLGQLDIGIAADVYMVGSLKVSLDPLEVTITVFAAMLISHLATLYPAVGAARQRPVDALRNE